MKYFITLIITGLVFQYASSQESPLSFPTEKEKVSYAIGLSFEKMLEEIDEQLPLDESASVEDFIKGIETIVNNTDNKNASYLKGLLMGVQLQNYLKNLNATNMVDYTTIYKAIRSKFNNDFSPIPDDELSPIVLNYFKSKDDSLQSLQAENRQKRLDKKKAENKIASEAYLKQNASKEGVKIIADGIQMKVIQEGQGKSPTEKDKVEINYVGRLVNGKIYDRTNETPYINAVKGFVPGFTTALKEMKKGGKYEIVIPADQAYGDRAPDLIGPSQALIFEVELIDVFPFTQEELKQKEAQEKELKRRIRELQ